MVALGVFGAALLYGDGIITPAITVLGAVEGRRLDMLSTPDGRIIPGEFFPHLMKDIAAVETFQVRQTREDRITIHVVKRSEPSEADMRYLRFEIDKVIGAGMTVEFRFVDEIALTPSGKRRVTVRDIPEPTRI